MESYEILEIICEEIHDGVEGNKILKRNTFAAAFGYIDAKFQVFLLQTYGFPLDLSSMEAAKRGLKVDMIGLRHELEMIGKKPSSISSTLREIEYFVRVAKELREERSNNASIHA